MIITAFIRLPNPVSSHEEVPGITTPVRVEKIDGSGAHLAEEIPPGQVTVYDLLSYEEVEREVMNSIGYEVYPGDEGGEDQEPKWVTVYTKDVVVDRVPKIETFAVTVAVE